MKDIIQKTYVLYVSGSQKTASSYRLEEDIQLAKAVGFQVVDSGTCILRKAPIAATFIGHGWVEKIDAIIKSETLHNVIVDAPLTASQHRNLERLWKCEVWDRTRLILAIFAQRARSATGKLQVQLAHLLYQKSRLVRAWKHLERQRGGFGFMGGPGESQIEIDRRLIQTRILKIQNQLEKVKKTRALHRKSRHNLPIVALVGYTNVGKSTLFHCLTQADILCADMPFATLDPTLRKVFLSPDQSILLSDTVGFIADLPEYLRISFQATLEEVFYADLLLHVRDVTDPHTKAHKEDVLAVLSQMQCHVPILEVWNKSDLLPDNAFLDAPEGLLISARNNQGIKNLLTHIQDKLAQT
jgi:GTP-binding protein HflX